MGFAAAAVVSLADVNDVRARHPLAFQPLDRLRRVLSFEPAADARMDEHGIGRRCAKHEVGTWVARDVSEF